MNFPIQWLYINSIVWFWGSIMLLCARNMLIKAAVLFTYSWITVSVLNCAVLSCSIVYDSLWPHGLWPTRPLCPWGFSRQEYWSGLLCPPPGDLPNPGIEPTSPAFAGGFFTIWATREYIYIYISISSIPKNTGVGSLSLLQGTFQPRNGTGVSCW